MLASPIRWPLGVSEVADHQARARGPLGAHTAPSAKALGLLQRGLDVRPATCLFELDDRAWTVRTEAGQVQVQPGEPASADASLRTDPKTLNALPENPDSPDAAFSDGRAGAAGDLPALRRLLRAATSPSPAPADS